MKSSKHNIKNSIPWLVLTACVFFIISQMLKISIPLDVGDGLQHFYIANYALEKPTMYLDHWGKPFFTLVSSPFSVFGLNGIITLNILLYILTCWIGFICLRLLNVSLLLHALLPMALLYSYDYTSNVLSGLTEILAGFILVLSAWFLIKKQWIPVAVFISILPFCRSEGQLIIVLGLIVLIYNKQYKAIPFLLSGFLIYAIIGFFALGDFFWYFNQNPYPKESIYGHGEWNHFWNLRKQYMGGIGLLMALFGGGSLIFIIVKKMFRNIRLDFLFFGIFSFFGILLTHAYLWTYGLRGSLGLTRVVTIGLPVFFITLLYLIQQFNFHKTSVKFTYLTIILFFSFYYNNSILRVTKNNSIEKSVLDASDFIKRERKGKSKVFYTHPLFAYGMGISPKKPDQLFYFKNFSHDADVFSQVKYGDFIIRDSHFGPKEMGLPLSVIENNKELVLVNEFIPSQQGESLHGEKWNVRIYQKIPEELHQQQQTTQTYKKLNLPITTYSIQPQQEFSDILHQTLKESASFLEIDLTAENNGGYLICDINNGQIWSNIPLKKGSNSQIKFPVKQNEIIKLYFWNPDKVKNSVEIVRISLSTVSFHPVLNNFE